LFGLLRSTGDVFFYFSAFYSLQREISLSSSTDRRDILPNDREWKCLENLRLKIRGRKKIEKTGVAQSSARLRTTLDFNRE